MNNRSSKADALNVVLGDISLKRSHWNRVLNMPTVKKVNVNGVIYRSIEDLHSDLVRGFLTEGEYEYGAGKLNGSQSGFSRDVQAAIVKEYADIEKRLEKELREETK